MKKNLFSLSLIAIFASCFIANGAMCAYEQTNQQELTKKAQKMKMQGKGKFSK